MVRVLSFLVFFFLSYNVFSSSSPKPEKILKPEVIQANEESDEIPLENKSEEQENQEEKIEEIDLYKGIMTPPTLEESTALDLSWNLLIKPQADPKGAYSVYRKYPQAFKEEQKKEFLRTLFRTSSFSNELLEGADRSFLEEHFPRFFETEEHKKERERLREEFFSKRKSSRKKSS